MLNEEVAFCFMQDLASNLLALCYLVFYQEAFFFKLWRWFQHAALYFNLKRYSLALDEWTFKYFCTTLSHYSMTQHKEKHAIPSEHHAALLFCADDWAPAQAHPERLCCLLLGNLQKPPGHGSGHFVLSFSGGAILWLFLGFYNRKQGKIWWFWNVSLSCYA